MLGWTALAINLWYVAPVAIGIVTSTGTNLARGILSYLMVHMAAFIGFTHTYSGSRRDLFKDATVGVFYASQSVVAADKTPWLAAGFVGYALGLWFLAKEMGWPSGVRMRRVISAGLVGVIALGGYYYALWKTDYYGRLLTAQRLYERDEYALAATKLEELLPRMPDETGYISLDIADYSYDAGDDKKATEYYNKSLKNLPPQKGTDRIYQEAHAILGLGMVADIGGDYKTAVAEFEKAAKVWPQFREPWSRLAVTYARMGNYEKALEAANKAADKLKSDAPEAYLVLAHIYSTKGDTEKAAAAYKRLAKLDDKLADRIGAKPEGWKNAVRKLTRSDLQFPLEKGIAMPPEQPGGKKAAKPTPPKKK
jgi:tetratricopeptide (TPR) repeat protein